VEANSKALSAQVLDLDYEAEANSICARIRETVAKVLHRRGLVVAVSGGIDSSTCLGLAVRALVRNAYSRSSCRSATPPMTAPARQGTDCHLGVQYLEQDIAPTLEAIGCYRWRDEAVRRALPEFGPGWKFKIVIPAASKGA
jgi:NAD+ synthase